MNIEFGYSDGSGNTYRIKSEKTITLEYIPVKPKYSSSGIYNGGDPVIKELNNAQYEQILFTLNKAIHNKECQIENRIKMSGMITKKTNKFKDMVIISPDSRELKLIESVLQELIKK